MFNMKKAAGIVALSLGMVAVSVASAHAQNLLTNNPGFNDVTLTGWTATGGYSGASDFGQPGKEGVGYAFLGQGAVLETATGSRAGVTTPGGEQFSLTFQARNDGATNPGTASIVFYDAGGTEILASSAVFTANDDLSSSYFVTGLAPATAATVAARITTTNNDPTPVSQFQVDNFVLTSAAVAVPEAGTSVLLLTGALGLVGMIVRRRNA